VKHSEQMDEIAPAWVKALNEMRDITRDNVADTGSYKYRFATLDAATKQARDVLGNHGLAVHQEAHGDQLGSVHVTTTVWHTSGQWISADPLVMPAKGGPQDVGSAISYSRRYALMSFLGLATDDDDGGGAQRAAVEDAKPHPLSERVAAVAARMKRLTDTDKDALKAWADGRSLAGSALLRDEQWLTYVEERLDHMDAGIAT
jgi:hypothetical protein